MKAIQTNGIRINEFEAQVNVIANYRGKQLVVSCITPISVNNDYHYYILVPREIRRLDNGNFTDNMRYEARKMMRDLIYNMK